METLAQKIIKNRVWVLIIFAIITLGFMSQAPKAVIDTDLKSQLPPNMPSRLDTEKIDELFGGTEMLLVIVESEELLHPEPLKQVRDLSRKIKRTKGVDKVMSLFEMKTIKGQDGMMVVEPAVPRIPRNEEQRKQLMQDLRQNDLVYGSVISENFELTAIIAMLETEIRDDEIINAFQKIIDDTPGPGTVRLGGLPVSRVEMGQFIKRDMRVLLPIGIGIMLIFLFACFKRIRGVVLPFLVVLMSIIFSIGLIVLLGWKIHTVTIILPIMLVAIANDYGIHMIAKYQEDNTPENDFAPKTLAERMFASLGRPIFLTGVTTMGGMLCLLGHILVPAQQLGVLAALGIAFALAASLFFIPALISFLPRSKPVLTQQAEKKPVMEKILWFFGRLVSGRPKSVIVAALALAVISVFGVTQVVVDTNPNGYYQPDHPTVKTNQLIDKHLGGSQNISIVFEGDIKNPEMLKKIDSIEQKLAAMDEVGSTSSIAKVVRQMSRALNDPGEPGYNQLPDTRNGVAQYFALYSMSGDPDDFSKMVDFPYEHAIVTARINETSTIVLQNVVDRVKTMTKDDPDVMLVGGFGVLLSDLANAVVNGQILSLLLATAIIAIMLSITFRSPVAGGVAAIPLALSILVLFGLMGVFNIELNIATAMLSSIMIGVGVDYTIHFLWRYREERRNGLKYSDAVYRTLTTTGRGIIFNALSVIVGFSALLFSSFLPVQFFGFLVVVSILACLVGALVLVPALCIVFKPKFLEPKQSGATV